MSYLFGRIHFSLMPSVFVILMLIGLEREFVLLGISLKEGGPDYNEAEEVNIPGSPRPKMWMRNIVSTEQTILHVMNVYMVWVDLT